MITLKLLIIYFSIAFLKFIWNTTLYFHCDFLMRKYIDNIYVNPFKNYNTYEVKFDVRCDDPTKMEDVLKNNMNEEHKVPLFN